MATWTRCRSRRGALLSSENLVKRGALALAILVVVLAVFASKFSKQTGLNVDAANYAQLARNLATGHGYTTSVLTPLQLALCPRTTNAPELIRPPAYVTVLALGMLIGGQNDKTVAVVSLLFLLATGLVLYLFAMQRFGQSVALWATFFYFVAVPILIQAISGMDTTFLSFLTVCIFALLLWNYRGGQLPVGEEEEPLSLGMGTVVAVGVLLALCYLTSYDSIVLVPIALYIIWKVDPIGGKRNLLLALGVFVVAVLPWIIRSSIIVGHPFISMHSYELEMYTSIFPGQSLFRRYGDVPHHPALALFTHAPSVLKKFIQDAGALHAELAMAAGPYMTPLFLVGLLLAAPRKKHVLLHGVLALALVMEYILLCFYQPLPRLLWIYTPLIAILASYWLLTLVGEWAQALPLVRRRWRRFGMSIDSVVLALVGLVVALPLIIYLFANGTTQANPFLNPLKTLKSQPYSYLATDLPWLVAWYSEKQALQVPLSDGDWIAMENANLAPTALFLSPFVLQAPAADQMQVWQRVLLQRRPVFRGMEMVPTWNAGGLLLAKPLQPGAAPAPAPAAAPAAAPAPAKPDQAPAPAR